MLLHFFIVGIGGGFGSLLRYYISVKCNKHLSEHGLQMSPALSY